MQTFLQGKSYLTSQGAARLSFNLTIFSHEFAAAVSHHSGSILRPILTKPY